MAFFFLQGSCLLERPALFLCPNSIRLKRAIVWISNPLPRRNKYHVWYPSKDLDQKIDHTKSKKHHHHPDTCMSNICTANGIFRRNYPPTRRMMSSDPVARPFLHRGLAITQRGYPCHLILLGSMFMTPLVVAPPRHLIRSNSAFSLAGRHLHQAHHLSTDPSMSSLLGVHCGQLVASACRRRQWTMPSHNDMVKDKGSSMGGAAPLHGGYRHPTQRQTGQFDDVPTTREQQ